MSTFQNSQQVFSTSGVSNIWLDANISFQTLRSSGGLSNVAAPVMVKAIYATVVSGFTGAGTSGQILIACDAISGATSGGNIAGNVLYFHYGGGVAISGGVQIQNPPVLVGLDYIVRSGLSVFTANSGGTNIWNLNVIYGSPQQ